MRAAAELNIPTVAVFPRDDANSLHTKKADEAAVIQGVGAAAYLDIEQMIATAKESDCDAIHPGYGFLSENAQLARRCEEESLVFVGPTVENLEAFGNKAQARLLAERCGVPLLKGSNGPVTIDRAREFLDSLGDNGAIMIKAISGGGGRGMRPVYGFDELEEAYTRCQSEALQAFGNGELYVEELIRRARHIEVQVIGDEYGAVSHLGERECSIQRQYQKVMEIAPSPGVSPELRKRLTRDAVEMAKAAGYRSAGTFEFMVDTDAAGDDISYAFIETNARLQVEHTVTEEVTDIDLVKTQLQIAGGSSLGNLGLDQENIPEPHGYAIQARINMETMGQDGIARPAGGKLTAFEVPSGRGIRVDTFGYTGYQTNPHYDSLLAKCIGHSTSASFADAAIRTYRAICEFKIEGVSTNIPFLQNILQHPDFIANRIYTRFVDDHIETLVETDSRIHQQLFFNAPAVKPNAQAGATVDNVDPLAVLQYGQEARTELIQTGTFDTNSTAPVNMAGMEGTVILEAPMQGTIVSIAVSDGDTVRKDQEILVMNAMKMEHVVRSPVSGTVRRIAVAVEDTIYEGHPLAFIEEREIDLTETEVQKDVDLDYIRPDLAEVVQRHDILLDDARSDSVAKRRKIGQRTARENIDDICDSGTFTEYGGLALAAQRRRRAMDDLIQNTPADGMIAGIGGINGDLFGDEKSRCAIVSYDYMVLAGTQGFQNHRKKDRIFEVAAKSRLPLILFSEGGGGRPGDTDSTGVAGQDVLAFHLFAKLSGLVPLVGVNAGRCFAGNAVLLGCCDVIIAKENSSIGMGGPAMIEGGSLGVFTPEEVGPMSIQVPNGVVDIPVKDEVEAVRAAKQYVSYFQGPVDKWECADQRLLRGIVPENRLRVYDMRAVIETMADTGSVLELRRHYGFGMITSFIRIEGRPLGVIANNPSHLSGAIDSPGANKAARMMQICDAFDIPVLFLSDTPGIMVGPEIEKTALVRHSCRMFVVSANMTVPYFTIVIRKSYGLGAQAMQGGSSHAPLLTVSWPTGEYGGMGLEGQVKLGYRKELMAIEEPEERKTEYEKMVARAYEHGKAINMASHFEIDDVIDPAESRNIIVRALKSVPPPPPRTGKKRPNVDTW
ncbi:MAG TPA: carbamoyl-phosphate synthase large subunit [Dehalococcoidia bacterium]|nr:carbamoyl-phosphate synthase large subunit [Dehalococcoidia bacterium]